MLGLPATSLKIDKRGLHLFCISRSHITSASDAEKRVVDHAVARSISAVDRLPSITPLFVGDNKRQ
jgi:hypothetical protein